MTNTEAVAEIFMKALKALPKAERDAVVVKIARDKEFSRDLIDLAVFAERRKEPSRPFREYLKEKKEN